MDTLKMVLGRVTDLLALIGSAVGVLVYIILFALAIFFMIMLFYYLDYLKMKRIRLSRITEIDRLSLPKLKLFIKTLFSLMGYEIVSEEEKKEGKDTKEEEKRKSPVDALVVKDGKKYALIIEKREKGVGKRLLDRLKRAILDHGCQGGIIINNGNFSPEELEEGRLMGLELWDRNRLIRELLTLQGKEDPAGRGFSFYIWDFFRWLVKGY